MRWFLVLAIAIVLLGLGAVGVANLLSSPGSRIGGQTLGGILVYGAPFFIASALLTVWVGYLANAGTPSGELHALSKWFGRISLVLVFAVPVVAAVAVSAAMKAEAGWVYIFVPAYVSFGAGIALLIFSGVLSHLAGRR